MAEGLGEALAAFEYPIHFLDFKTFASAVPKRPGSRPFEAVPVQWSCHSREVGGQLLHQEFLADGLGDPREAFARTLLQALGSHGSICVYSSYEKRILNETSTGLPHLAAELRGAISRLVDLLPIIREHVYLPAFQGSYSIKKVLPVLVPGFDYSALQVRDGLMAGDAFARMRMEADPSRRATLQNDLLAYCAQDTLAMVRIREGLMALA